MDNFPKQRHSSSLKSLDSTGINYTPQPTNKSIDISDGHMENGKALPYYTARLDRYYSMVA